MPVVILQSLESIGRLEMWIFRSGLKLEPLSIEIGTTIHELEPAIHRALFRAETTFHDTRGVEKVKTSIYSDFGTN